MGPSSGTSRSPRPLIENAVKATYKEGVLQIVLKGAVLVAEAKKQRAKAIPIEVTRPELPAVKA